MNARLKAVEPIVPDSPRLQAKAPRAIDLNAVVHAELRARREARQ